MNYLQCASCGDACRYLISFMTRQTDFRLAVQVVNIQWLAVRSEREAEPSTSCAQAAVRVLP